MSTLTVKELAAPTGYDLKIASGETLDLKSQGTVTMPTGSVLQTVTANILGTTTTNISSFVSTVVAATITPSSTSSKILVMMNGGMNGFAGGSGGQVGYTKIYRGTTALESTTKGL